jgi:putative membrane protein
MTRWITALTMATAVAVAPAWALAQSSAPAQPATKDKSATTTDRTAGKNGSGKLASGEQKFVSEALKHGMAEVELGKLASEKASNEAVKQFGQKMADDHGKAGEELKKIAQDKGVTPPTEMDGKHKRLHDRLSKLSGAQFDRAYMDEMVKEHRNDVKEFQREANRAKDTDVKGFASKTLPTLQEHLKQAESVRSQVSRTAKGGDADAGAASVKGGEKGARTDKK